MSYRRKTLLLTLPMSRKRLNANRYRPHRSLGRVPPVVFRENLKPEISTLEWPS